MNIPKSSVLIYIPKSSAHEHAHILYIYQNLVCSYIHAKIQFAHENIYGVAYVMLCYVMLCYVMLCYVMLCYVMLCYVMFSYVMLCYVMLIKYLQ
jgi:hypothetical protein